MPCLIQDRERHRENINIYSERRREILKPKYQGEKTVGFQGFGKKQIAQHQKWNLWNEIREEKTERMLSTLSACLRRRISVGMAKLDWFFVT